MAAYFITVHILSLVFFFPVQTGPPIDFAEVFLSLKLDHLFLVP